MLHGAWISRNPLEKNFQARLLALRTVDVEPFIIPNFGKHEPYFTVGWLNLKNVKPQQAGTRYTQPLGRAFVGLSATLQALVECFFLLHSKDIKIPE